MSLCVYSFNLHAAASSWSSLVQLNERSVDHVGKDRHTCGETDRQTDGQIHGQMGCLVHLTVLGAIRQTE